MKKLLLLAFAGISFFQSNAQTISANQQTMINKFATFQTSIGEVDTATVTETINDQYNLTVLTAQVTGSPNKSFILLVDNHIDNQVTYTKFVF